jgi:hypothetical protein
MAILLHVNESRNCVCKVCRSVKENQDETGSISLIITRGGAKLGFKSNSKRKIERGMRLYSKR